MISYCFLFYLIVFCLRLADIQSTAACCFFQFSEGYLFSEIFGLQAMAADVYSALLKTLVISDCEDMSCYPVRASAAGAMIKLLEVIPFLD